MSLTTAGVLILFTWLLGTQWGRIRAEARMQVEIEKRVEAMLSGVYRWPAPMPPLHRDQEAYGLVPPARNVWTVPRLPCWWEMRTAYQRWRAPRPRTLEEMEAFYGRP